MGKKAYKKSFASIYDDVMSAVPYNLWKKYLYEILSFYNKDVEKVVDLACGTGNMCVRLAQDGKDVIGIDGSREMLGVAEEKAGKKNLDIDFVHSDLRDFELEERVDLAFSVFDSLNYILSLNDLKKVFDNVYDVLKNDGVFIFDLNTKKRLMSIEPGTTLLNGEDYTCFWRDIIDEENTKWKVKLKIYFDDDTTNYFEELHEETSYPLEKVYRALEDTGFEFVKIFKAYTFVQGNDQDNRVYFVAFKNGSHVKKRSFVKRMKELVKWRITKLFL